LVFILKLESPIFLHLFDHVYGLILWEFGEHQGFVLEVERRDSVLLVIIIVHTLGFDGLELLLLEQDFEDAFQQFVLFVEYADVLEIFLFLCKVLMLDVSELSRELFDFVFQFLDDSFVFVIGYVWVCVVR
jgi:hypothetical protein